MKAEPAASAVLPPDLRLYRFLCDLAAELAARPVMLREPAILRRARELAALLSCPAARCGPSWRCQRRIAVRRFNKALLAADASRENIERQIDLGWSVRP